MLRYLFNQVFDLKTTSLHDGDTRVFGAVAGISDLIGHYDRAAGADVAAMQDLQLIKTHEEPTDTGPAIYIVRDGRAALVSYMHYLRQVEGVSAELPAIIRGEVWPGSWSDHFRKWSPLTRPRTLLLRYEDLTGNTDNVCDRLADFVGVSARRNFGNEFPTLHAVFPQFFHRGGNSANIAEMKPHLALFDSLHTDLMKQLGYYA